MAHRFIAALAIAIAAVGGVTACTRTDAWFEYTPTPTSATHSESALADAERSYMTDARGRLSTLQGTTSQFAAAFTAGDDDAARQWYFEARVLWESVRPVARQFPDLLASLGNRRTDLGQQELWTGWHRAELALWPAPGEEPLTDADRQRIAGELLDYTTVLQERASSPDFSLSTLDMAEGATEAVGNLAVNHALGLADVYSSADLWGIQGGVDGAGSVYRALEPLLQSTDPALATEIEHRIDAVYAQLARHGSVANGFTPHRELTAAELTDLVRSLDALAHALSGMSTAVIASPESSP